MWLLGSFAVLSLLYRAEISADPPMTAAEVLTKRTQAERAYAKLSAPGVPVSASQLAAAAGLSASYARALVADFQAQPSAPVQGNGRASAPVEATP